MEGLLIDISDGSCSGGCGHCKHGARAQGTIATFTDSILETYRRLEQHAHKTKTYLRVVYSNRAGTLPSSLTAPKAQSLALSYVGISDLLSDISEVIKKVLALTDGNSMLETLALNIHSKEQEAARNLSLVVGMIELQAELSFQFPNQDVLITLNNNTSTITQEDVLQDSAKILQFYLIALKKIYGERIQDSGMKILCSGKVVTFHGNVSLDGRIVALAGRYVDDGYPSSKSNKIWSTLHDTTKDLTLALFPWGVHVDHSTLNINDSTLRFSHEDFWKLLCDAENSGVPLKQVCWEAVQARQNQRELIQTA